MEHLTRLMIRFRWVVVAVWLVALLAGGFASTKLSGLLANTFTVPGTDSERVRTVLSRELRRPQRRELHGRLPGAECNGPDVARRLQARVDSAAHVVPTGRATELRVGAPNLLYGDVTSTLKLSDAKGYTDELLDAVGQPPEWALRT